ncbi:MAG: choice-of-anchor B family protein [Bacteroidota bacterium]
MRHCLLLLIGLSFLSYDALAQASKADVPLPSEAEYRAQHAGAPSVQASSTRLTEVPCDNGRAASFPCENVELVSFLPKADMGARFTQLNDMWGWTDPETGRNYAIVGRHDGTSFVDVSDPANPVYLGDLPKPAASTAKVWRDIKVYNDHAFIVADQTLRHGMQVFDLTRLRGLTEDAGTFTEDTRYTGVENAHNIVINESTGFAYLVGSNTCGGGLHIVNIQDPMNPTFEACFAHPNTGRRGTGYTHDAQCIVYDGPDADYSGREICFNSNETAVSIADVTDKSDIIPISIGTYPNSRYIHQGWLTPDQRYFIQNDELDEFNRVVTETRTLIWDLEDLDSPELLTEYEASVPAIDHNIYVVGDRAYLANYTSGLRILDISDIENPVEVGFFDTYPDNDRAVFAGVWTSYPFFGDGTVAISSQGEGLFMVRPSGDAALRVGVDDEADVPASFSLDAAYPNPFNPETTVQVTMRETAWITVAAYDLAGREVARLFDGVLSTGTFPLTFYADGLPSGTYLIRAVSDASAQSQKVTLLK